MKERYSDRMLTLVQAWRDIMYLLAFGQYKRPKGGSIARIRQSGVTYDI